MEGDILCRNCATPEAYRAVRVSAVRVPDLFPSAFSPDEIEFGSIGGTPRH